MTLILRLRDYNFSELSNEWNIPINKFTLSSFVGYMNKDKKESGSIDMVEI